VTREDNAWQETIYESVFERAGSQPQDIAPVAYDVRNWRIAALGLVAGNIRLRTKAEAGEPLLAPIYEFTASFLVLQGLQALLALLIRLKWRSIVFTAGGSRSG
jgi:hypothetical protein